MLEKVIFAAGSSCECPRPSLFSYIVIRVWENTKTSSLDLETSSYKKLNCGSVTPSTGRRETTLTGSKDFNKSPHKQVTDRSGLQDKDLGASFLQTAPQQGQKQGSYAQKSQAFAAELQFSPSKNQILGTFLVCSIIVSRHKMGAFQPSQPNSFVLSVVRSSICFKELRNITDCFYCLRRRWVSHWKVLGFSWAWELKLCFIQ